MKDEDLRNRVERAAYNLGPAVLMGVCFVVVLGLLAFVGRT